MPRADRYAYGKSFGRTTLNVVKIANVQHAPQYPNLGLGQEYELLDWLQQLTFPREAKFTDLEYAEKVYDEVVRRNLNAGVSAGAIFGEFEDQLYLWVYGIDYDLLLLR